MEPQLDLDMNLDWEKFGYGLVAVVLTIAGGLGFRRANSATGAANAQDAALVSKANAEKDVFDNALQEIGQRADRWERLYRDETERLRGLLEDARAAGRTEVERVREEYRAQLDAERAEYTEHLQQESKVHKDLRDQLVAKDLAIAGLEAEKRHRISANRFRVLAMKRRHPEIDDWDLLDSEPMPLGPA